MERSITINGKSRLAATVHYPSSEGDAASTTRFPVIIICHGFVGNRIGTDRLFVKAARSLCKQGYFVFRFDYAGCGDSDGAYGETGFDSWIDQTRLVLDYALDMDCADLERITLVGHSLGGATALLTAARDKRVRSLALWAPVAYPLKDILSITGKSVYDDAVRYGAADYLGYPLKREFFDSLASKQPLNEGLQFGGDVLLVHGSSDEVVPVEYTLLYQKLLWMRPDGHCDKEIIAQANHTFSSEQSASSLIDRTTEWLRNMERRKKDWSNWII